MSLPRRRWCPLTRCAVCPAACANDQALEAARIADEKARAKRLEALREKDRAAAERRRAAAAAAKAGRAARIHRQASPVVLGLGSHLGAARGGEGVTK